MFQELKLRLQVSFLSTATAKEFSQIECMTLTLRKNSIDLNFNPLARNEEKSVFRHWKRGSTYTRVNTGIMQFDRKGLKISQKGLVAQGVVVGLTLQQVK